MGNVLEERRRSQEFNGVLIRVLGECLERGLFEMPDGVPHAKPGDGYLYYSWITLPPPISTTTQRTTRVALGKQEVHVAHAAPKIIRAGTASAHRVISLALVLPPGAYYRAHFRTVQLAHPAKLLTHPRGLGIDHFEVSGFLPHIRE